MYLRKVGTDQVYAPTPLLMARQDMERITDETAKKVRVQRAKKAKAKRTSFLTEQTGLINSAVADEPATPKRIEDDGPMVKSISDVEVEEPRYDEASSEDPIGALLEKHQ